jgi:nucleoside-diphosphate-sugar epimerase
MHAVAAEHPTAVGEIFNCYGPGPTRGSEFVAIVKRLVPGIAVKCGFPWSMAQGGEIRFSMEKARRLLDFQPVFSLEDSLKSIVDWVHDGGLAHEPAETENSFGAGVESGTAFR